MLRATVWTHGRRGAAVGASAAVACLGALLASCGGGNASGDGGYVAVGAAGGQPRMSVRPTGSVQVVPLDGADSSEPEGSSGESPSAGTGAPGAGAPGGPSLSSVPGSGGPGPEGAQGTPGGPGPSSAGGADSGRTPTSSPPAGTPGASPAPAVLTVSDPERAAADQRWCEKVTLVFRNSGGTAVRSGTVTFGTHIIGALGIDWGTVESEVALPAPIEAGARSERTWTVCVDAWRVPLGMHIETRDVDVRWN
ncbi:hypothetical protein [Streptomyces sp. S.PB5]|uniref:hypothetical protein n=1 Tax=Streptomyces sp. S.PB5 TaxID=3020844 RepID=UPI0025B0ADE5|nr:hypothetical protein [Streptomyces sp. S.PB5]MDN3023848.1 hypothetical protein [Streptomyces sp. S.PB5]